MYFTQLLHLQSFSVTSNDGIFFSPSVETYEAEPNDPTVFLPKAPKDLLPNNEFARVPMIIGQIASEYYSSLIRGFLIKNPAIKHTSIDRISI